MFRQQSARANCPRCGGYADNHASRRRSHADSVFLRHIGCTKRDGRGRRDRHPDACRNDGSQSGSGRHCDDCADASS